MGFFRDPEGFPNDFLGIFTRYHRIVNGNLELFRDPGRFFVGYLGFF